MIWKRRQSPEPGGRPSDEAILGLLRDALVGMAPQLVEGCPPDRQRHAKLLTLRGEYASHLDPSDSAGLPGWHAVTSGILGYGGDPESNDALQSAMLEHEVLRTLAPSLVPALDRSAHNGIKVLYQRTPTEATAEVRVNGLPHADSSRALAELPWPDVAAPTIVRFYAVAVNPA